jgi:hypothetical protein
MMNVVRRYLLALRRPTVFVPLVLVLLIGTGLLSPLSAAADPDGSLAPQGIGDLFTTGSLQGTDTPTLYEAYSVQSYTFWQNVNADNFMEKSFNGLANVLMFLLVAVVRGCIVIVQTMFTFTNTKPMTDAIGAAMNGAATELVKWLLPSAIAIGGVYAYITHKRADGGVFGQVAWVVVGGVLAVSFAVSSPTWVNAVDNTRQIGSSAVMSATSSSLTATETPFAYPEPAWTGSAQDSTLRKAGDSIWRAYVVTPWCIGQFGSTNACERYGNEFLAVGLDKEAQNKWMWDTVHVKDKNETKAQPYDWVWGYNAADRVGIAGIALLVGIVFSFLMISLAFSSLFAFISALFVLFAGVVFAMLWCIPGKPRQWGTSWLNTLVGLVIQSMMASVILSAVLVLTTAAFALTSSMGWGAAAGMAIVVAIAAMKMRETIGHIVNAVTPGGGSTGMLGYMAMRGASKLVSRGRGAISGRIGPAGRAASKRNKANKEKRANSTGEGSSSAGRAPRFRSLNERANATPDTPEYAASGGRQAGQSAPQRRSRGGSRTPTTRAPQARGNSRPSGAASSSSPKPARSTRPSPREDAPRPSSSAPRTRRPASAPAPVQTPRSITRYQRATTTGQAAAPVPAARRVSRPRKRTS